MTIGQGRVSALALVVVVCALAGAPRCAQAVQHQVGGAPGWSLPSAANVNYTVWATTQKFVVGDTLYFNYSKAYHNVLEVTKAKYDSCNTSNPLSTHDDGATIIPLNKTGTFYFICGFPTHCSLGQKFAVNVVNASASAPAPTPITSPASSPSPTVPAVPPSSPAPGVSAPEGSPPPGSLGNSSLPPVPSPPSSASAMKWMVSTEFAAAVSYIAIFLL